MLDLPVKLRWEELCDESLIIRPQSLRVARFVAFTVQIVWVESADSFECLEILFIGEVRICAFTMPPVYINQ